MQGKDKETLKTLKSRCFLIKITINITLLALQLVVCYLLNLKSFFVVVVSLSSISSRNHPLTPLGSLSKFESLPEVTISNFYW